jgi:Cys-tRNA(Pro)/Cys-tRNA(Cys) deacylase
MPLTNNVTRLLEARRLAFTSHALPTEKLGALEAAQFMGVPAERVFKTIVVLREKPGKPLLALVPGPAVVDLKRLAALLGEKKVHLPSEHEAEQITGLQAGGISPLALLTRGFQVVIDSAASRHATIFVSGGQRGLNIELAPQALIDLTGARLAGISRSDAAA